LIIAMLADGELYQSAAALAGATYRAANPDAKIRMYVPEGAPTTVSFHEKCAHWDLVIIPFHFVQKKSGDRMTQLKPTAFAAAVKGCPPDKALLFADADTVCMKKIDLASYKEHALLGMGFMRQDANPKRWRLALRTTHDVRGDAYIPPRKRRPYINAGVVLCARAFLDVAEKIMALAYKSDFAHKPFQDQAVFYYAFCKYPARFAMLPPKLNYIVPAKQERIPADVEIAHVAGGIGKNIGPGSLHERLCKHGISAGSGFS